MHHSRRTIFRVLISAVALVSLPAVAARLEAAEGGARIAAISGVHVPHQGFALSATVPSDRTCLELAQNLASELGSLCTWFARIQQAAAPPSSRSVAMRTSRTRARSGALSRAGDPAATRS